LQNLSGVRIASPTRDLKNVYIRVEMRPKLTFLLYSTIRRRKDYWKTNPLLQSNINLTQFNVFRGDQIPLSTTFAQATPVIAPCI
jgi:hypothetical protein